MCVCVCQALRNFEKGVHLDPTDQEVWTEDLSWARKLVREKETREKERTQAES